MNSIGKFLQFGSVSIWLNRYFKLLAIYGKSQRFPHSERHHIFPKFAFGENSDVRYVSYRVHFILHELLWKHFKFIGHKFLTRKAAYPLVRMCGKNTSIQNLSGIRFSSRVFAISKIANYEALVGENNPMFGRRHSVATRMAMSQAKKGKPMPEEQRQKMRGRTVSESAKLNMKNAKRPEVNAEECAARSERMRAVWARRKER